jgi:arylsulfatase A-like enzyme
MVEKAAAGQNVYEDILNLPLIIRYPGNKQNGKRTAELVSLVDIYPTLVELLGLKLPELKHPLQGESMAQNPACRKTHEKKIFCFRKLVAGYSNHQKSQTGNYA